MKLILNSVIGRNNKPVLRLCKNSVDDCKIELSFTNNTVSVAQLRESLSNELNSLVGINLLSITKDNNKYNEYNQYKIIKKEVDGKRVNLDSELEYSDLLDIDETYVIDFYPSSNDIINLNISPNIIEVTKILQNLKKSNVNVTSDIDMRFLKRFEISPSEYLKSELDNNLRKQTDNITKLFYKLGFTNELYITLNKDNLIEFDKNDNITVKDLEKDYISRRVKPAIIKYNREFSKELLLSSYADYMDKPAIIPDIIKNQISKIKEEKIKEGEPLIKPLLYVPHAPAMIQIPDLTDKKALHVGGNKLDFRKIRNLLELAGEPKHDFGKGPSSRSGAISHKINSKYDGTISGEKKTILDVKDSLSTKGFLGRIFNKGLNFNTLLTGSHEAKLLHTLSFIKKYHIDIDDTSDKGKLTQLHSFFRFYKYIDDTEFIDTSANQAGQLTEMKFKDDFRRVFKANVNTLGIKHFVYDTGAGIDFLGKTSGLKKELKKESKGLNPGEFLPAINLIVPLVNIWDPATASINNFDHDVLAEFLDGEKQSKFVELLKTTYLENNTVNSDDIWFPKRDSISKYYSVRYNEEHKLSMSKKPSKSPPLILSIKKRGDVLEKLSIGEYKEIKLMGGYSVDNLSRAMKCIVDEKGDISKLKAVKRNTKTKTEEDTAKLRMLVSALMGITFDDYEEDSVERSDIRINEHGEVLESDKNKLRIRILLDMKKSGDWSQVKWVRHLNKTYPNEHKTMFISGDNLCALMAILNGIPTIFGSTGMEKLESGGHVSAKLLSFYAGSPSKLTANEITQFQIYVDNQIGVEFLTPQHTLKEFSEIESSLKEKYPILKTVPFNTSIRDMLNEAKKDSSSMPDYLLYKLTYEYGGEVTEPSENIIDKSLFQVLFSDESNILRKHLLDIANFKFKLTNKDKGSISISELEAQEPTILNQIGIVKGIVSVITSSNEFIMTDYNDIALKTDNIARCINVINSDLIYGDSGGTTKTISKPHIDKLNKLCGIRMEYGELARDTIVQRTSLIETVNNFNKTFTANLGEELEEASKLISDDGDKIPIQKMSVEQMEQIRTSNFCDEVYGKPTIRHWFRSSAKIITLMQNMSSILSKVLEVNAMNDMYVRLVALYNNITGILSDINLFSHITPENEADTMWLKNIFLSSIEMGYYKLIGLERSKKDTPRPIEKMDDERKVEEEINSVQVNLAQITTNIECLLIGMNKFSSLIMSQIGNKSDMVEIFNSYVEILESQETTFSEMFKMFDSISSRGFIHTMDKSFTEELEETTVDKEDIIDESHIPLVNAMASDESVQLSDIIDSDSVDIESEEVLEIPDEEKKDVISTPERNIIMKLKFKDSSRSKYKIYNNRRVKVLRIPFNPKTGLYKVKLNDGEEKGRIIFILGTYVSQLDEVIPSSPQSSPPSSPLSSPPSSPLSSPPSSPLSSPPSSPPSSPLSSSPSSPLSSPPSSPLSSPPSSPPSPHDVALRTRSMDR